MRRRVHDGTDTGALTSQTDPHIVSYSAAFYDEASRSIRSVEYGTNSTNDLFESGGAEPTISQSSPPAVSTSGAELVSATTYNERGLVETQTEPDGTITKLIYDDANRVVGTIENFDDQATNLATVARSVHGEWLADLGDNPAAGD